MAIDSNVLINERIREELRWGATPHAALTAGYERAFGTILDSNVTTLIAGIRAAHLRHGTGARLRRRPLPRHPDVDVLGGVRLARDRQPDLRRPQAPRKISIGQVWRPRRGGRRPAK
jgi:preprotein translocase subunit SecD